MFVNLTSCFHALTTGIQFKRIEALTRSQTLADMRQSVGVAPGNHAHPLTLGEQAEMYPISAVPTHRGSARDRFVFLGHTLCVYFTRNWETVIMYEFIVSYPK